MNIIAKRLVKRLLLLSICAVAATLLLSIEFTYGALSARAIGVILLLSCAVLGITVMLILRKSARELRSERRQPGVPLDEATRKRSLLGIWVGKAAVAVLAVLLVLGLVRGGPVLPLVVGALVNLGLMAVIIRVVVRLGKSLN